jgi:DNA-binding transcriptional ArsR family regulator
MAESPKGEREDSDHLTGTTYRVYRYMLKRGSPAGVSEVQKALGLSSPSVSQYHIRKLLRLGLIREEQGGYSVDRMVMKNFIRIRRVSIPSQMGYVAFFSVTLAILLVYLRPSTINSLYFFALVVNVVALTISTYEATKTWEHF